MFYVRISKLLSVEYFGGANVNLDSAAGNTFRVDIENDEFRVSPTAIFTKYVRAKLNALQRATVLTLTSTGETKIHYHAAKPAHSLTLDTNLTGRHNLHAYATPLPETVNLCIHTGFAEAPCGVDACTATYDSWTGLAASLGPTGGAASSLRAKSSSPSAMRASRT